jgi:hypothetical protein
MILVGFCMYTYVKKLYSTPYQISLSKSKSRSQSKVLKINLYTLYLLFFVIPICYVFYIILYYIILQSIFITSKFKVNSKKKSVS